MKRYEILIKVAAFAILLGGFSVTTFAKKPGGGGGGGTGGCPKDVECPDVMAPVICSNGQVYANSCYAYRDCATDCVPTGDI